MKESNPEFRYFKLWLATGYLLMAVIIYLSLTATPVEVDLGFPYQDKFFHALAYFSLMGWFAQMYHMQGQRFAFAIAFILMGIILEYLQVAIDCRIGHNRSEVFGRAAVATRRARRRGIARPGGLEAIGDTDAEDPRIEIDVGGNRAAVHGDVGVEEHLL